MYNTANCDVVLSKYIMLISLFSITSNIPNKACNHQPLEEGNFHEIYYEIYKMYTDSCAAHYILYNEPRTSSRMKETSTAANIYSKHLKEWKSVSAGGSNPNHLVGADLC